jgi:hypothetical protein
VKNFGRVAWNARLKLLANEVPAYSSGTGSSGRRVSDDMPDPKLYGPVSAQAVLGVALLYLNSDLYIYAVSENRQRGDFAVRDAVQ